MGIAIWDARIRSFSGSSEMFTVANSHAVSWSINAAAPTRTGTIWRRTGPLDSQPAPEDHDDEEHPAERDQARWIVSMTLAAFSSGAMATCSARSRAPRTGARGTRAGRSRTGRCRRWPGPPRPEATVGNDNRNRANPAAQRSENQMPTVNTTGLGPGSSSARAATPSRRAPSGARGGWRGDAPRGSIRRPRTTSRPAPEARSPARSGRAGRADQHPQAEHARR